MRCTLNTNFQQNTGLWPNRSVSAVRREVHLVTWAMPDRAASQVQGWAHLPLSPHLCPGKNLDLQPRGPEAEREKNWALGLDRKVQSPKHHWRKRKEQGARGEGAPPWPSEVGFFGLDEEEQTLGEKKAVGPSLCSACQFSHCSQMLQGKGIRINSIGCNLTVLIGFLFLPALQYYKHPRSLRGERSIFLLLWCCPLLDIRKFTGENIWFVSGVLFGFDLVIQA